MARRINRKQAKETMQYVFGNSVVPEPENNKITLSKNTSNELEDILNETSFEIWNAGCTHRMRITSDGEFGVYTYSNPLHPIKTYKTISGALTFLSKMDN